MLGFIVIFFLLIILSMPIAIALGVGGIFFLIKETSLPYLAIIQRMFTGIDSFPLMAIPFFIIAGSLMNSGVLQKELLIFLIYCWFLRGGLAAIQL
jgi:C4-dicarboxylate transporter DctM subunit